MSHLQKRLQLLVQPPFRWFVISCLIATFSNGLSYVTLTWLVLQADNSVAAVAVLMLYFWLPSVLFGPLLGVLSDRYSRKLMLVLSNGSRGLVLIGFGWYFYHQLSAPAIYGLMAIIGFAFSAYLPAAIAFIREVVNEDDLMYANSTIDIAYEVGNVVGMGLAGFFIAWFSAPTTILISGIILVLSAGAMMLVKALYDRKSSPATKLQLINDFLSGTNYLRAHPKLIVIYSVQLMIMVGFMTTPILLAPFAKNILHATVSQFGQIDAALSVGVIFGGLFAPWLADRFGLMHSLKWLCVSLAVLFAIFPFNREVLGAALIYFALGASLSVWPLVVTKAQQLTDLNFQARVQSVFNGISGIAILIIFLLVDVGSHFVSVSWLYALEVVCALTAALLLWRFNRGLR